MAKPKKPKKPPESLEVVDDNRLTTAEIAANLRKTLDDVPAEEQVLLYNPDDEPIVTHYGGHAYTLHPNGTTRIVSHHDKTPASYIADFFVGKWGEFGVVRVKHPVVNSTASDPDEQEIVDEAEATYLKATLKWATTILKRRQKEEFEIKAAGCPPPVEPPDVQKARTWVATYSKRLKEAGLTG